MGEANSSPDQGARISLRDRLARFIPHRFRIAKTSKITTRLPDMTNQEKVVQEGDESTTAPSVPFPVPDISTQPAVESEHRAEVINADVIKEEEVEPITTTEMPEEKAESPRVTDVATLLSTRLGENLTPPEFKSMGIAAIIGTNETVGDGFFEAVQAKKPDGYIVGVGIGNALTLVHCFPDDSIPKGLVLSDIDPRVVAVGKLLVKKVRESDSPAVFKKNFFGLSPSDFQKEMQVVIQEEGNSVLQQRLATEPSDTWDKIWKQVQHDIDYPLPWRDIRAYTYEGQNVNVAEAMMEKFSVFKHLADANNIAVAYCDFTNPAFVEAVRQLPDFENSTNIIYLSNIVDHITARGRRLEGASVMEHLRGYEKSLKPPVFIDTLGQRLNYYLRARHTLAHFTKEDFQYLGIQPRSKKPLDLLFAE